MELKWSSGTQLIQGCVSSTTIANNNFKMVLQSYRKLSQGLYGANWYSNSSSQGTYGVQLTSGNIGMMAMDRDNNKFWWGVNGSWGMVITQLLIQTIFILLQMIFCFAISVSIAIQVQVLMNLILEMVTLEQQLFLQKALTHQQ